MNTKICNKCKIELPFNSFSNDKNKKDGKSTICKACKKAYADKWRTDNKELKARLDKEYRENNADKIAEHKHKYYEANKESILAKNKARYQDNSESYYAIHKLWVEQNKDKVATIKKAYKLRRRDKENASNLSSKELTIWLSEQPKVCAYCGIEITNGYHIDHVEPLSKDGKHEVTNLALSCPSCNLRKSSKSMVLWLASK